MSNILRTQAFLPGRKNVLFLILGFLFSFSMSVDAAKRKKKRPSHKGHSHSHDHGHSHGRKKHKRRKGQKGHRSHNHGSHSHSHSPWSLGVGLSFQKSFETEEESHSGHEDHEEEHHEGGAEPGHFDFKARNLSLATDLPVIDHSGHDHGGGAGENSLGGLALIGVLGYRFNSSFRSDLMVPVGTSGLLDPEFSITLNFLKKKRESFATKLAADIPASAESIEQLKISRIKLEIGPVIPRRKWNLDAKLKASFSLYAPEETHLDHEEEEFHEEEELHEEEEHHEDEERHDHAKEIFSYGGQLDLSFRIKKNVLRMGSFASLNVIHRELEESLWNISTQILKINYNLGHLNLGAGAGLVSAAEGFELPTTPQVRFEAFYSFN